MFADRPSLVSKSAGTRSPVQGLPNWSSDAARVDMRRLKRAGSPVRRTSARAVLASLKDAGRLPITYPLARPERSVWTGARSVVVRAVLDSDGPRILGRYALRIPRSRFYDHDFTINRSESSDSGIIAPLTRRAQAVRRWARQLNGTSISSV